MRARELTEAKYRFKKIGPDDYEADIRGHKVSIMRYDPKMWGDRGPVEYKLYVDEEWIETYRRKKHAVEDIDWAIDGMEKYNESI